MGNIDHYTYRVTWSEDDGEFVGLCAEFPSLSHLDISQVGALSGIVELVKDVVADLAERREEIPAPLADRQFSGKFQVRVPPAIHRLLAIQAAEAGVSLNRYVSARLSG